MFHCLLVFAVVIPLFFYQPVVWGNTFFFSCNHLYALSLFLSLTPLSVIRAPAAPTVTFSLKSIFCSPTSHDVTVFLPLVVWFCLIDFLGVQNYLVFIKLCSRNVASLGSYSSAILSLLMSTKHFLNLSRNHSVSWLCIQAETPSNCTMTVLN